MVTISSTKAMITLNQPTLEAATQLAKDVDVNALSDAVAVALSETPTLKSGAFAQDLSVSFSNPSLSDGMVICPIHRSVPPGTTALSENDCQCSLGYSFNQALESCEPCSLGQYKNAVGNKLCTSCQPQTSTLVLGATSAQQCHCQASMYASSGQCVECRSGFYCPGSGLQCFCSLFFTCRVASKNVLE